MQHYTVVRAREIIIRRDVRLLKDAMAGQALIRALNGFLSEKEKPNKDNAFVRNEDLPAASIGS